MDPQVVQMLMQYMAAAKGGNKNVSSISNNLSDPVLLALAGVLDPYYGAGDSSTTYGQFANDPSTPAAVRAVMDYVDQGMNQYQIEAQINNLDDKVIKDSGYTDDILISMGRDMVKEGGKKGSNVFTKAGLRNPNDIYELDDVPLGQDETESYFNYLKKAQESDKQTGTYEQKLNVAKSKNKRPKAFRDELLDSVDLDEDIIYPFRGALKRSIKEMPDAELAQRGGFDVMPSQKVRDDVSRAQAEYYDQQSKVQGDLLRAQAVREGALRRASQSGRTPFTDQTSTLLKFIAGTK
jgi:hypothetical protein